MAEFAGRTPITPLHKYAYRPTAPADTAPPPPPPTYIPTALHRAAKRKDLALIPGRGRNAGRVQIVSRRNNRVVVAPTSTVEWASLAEVAAWLDVELPAEHTERSERTEHPEHPTEHERPEFN